MLIKTQIVTGPFNVMGFLKKSYRLSSRHYNKDGIQSNTQYLLHMSESVLEKTC